MSEFIKGYARAQYVYDNMVPQEYGPSDEQIEAYKETQEYSDWMMENAGNSDWVEFEEKNLDLLCEMVMEWVIDNTPEPYGDRV